VSPGPPNEHLADALAGAEEGLAEDVEHHVLGRDALGQLTLQDEAHGLGDLHAHVLGEPGVGHVGRAHAEGEAAEHTGHAGVAVRAGDDLTRQREILDHGVVADGLGAARRVLTVEPEVVILGERRLRRGESVRVFEQAHRPLLFAHHITQEGEVVAEGHDALRVAQGCVFADALLVQRPGHGRDVLVAEAHIRAHEEGVAGLHRGHAELARLGVAHGVASDDLLDHGHGPGWGLDRGRTHLAREPQLVVGEEAAGAHDARADGIESAGELAEWDGLAGFDARDEREVRGGQKPDVLGVLAVDLLDALGDHELHARRLLAVGRRLARGAAALGQARDEHAGARILQRILLEGLALEPDQRVPTQGLVVVETDPAGRDLVRADVVAQGTVLIERELLARELALLLLRILREVEDSSIESDCVGSRQACLLSVVRRIEMEPSAIVEPDASGGTMLGGQICGGLLAGGVIGALAFVLLQGAKAFRAVVDSDGSDQDYLAKGLEKLKIYFMAKGILAILLTVVFCCVFTVGIVLAANGRFH